MVNLIQHPHFKDMQCYRDGRKIYATAQQISEGTQTTRQAIQRSIKSLVDNGMLSEDDLMQLTVASDSGAKHAQGYSQKAIMMYIARMNKQNEFTRRYMDFVEGAINQAIITVQLTDIRNLYKVIREVISNCADYTNKESHLFADLQNKIYYAIAELVAADIVAGRCNPYEANIGMTVDVGSITLAKAKKAYNYLYQEEVDLYQHFIKTCDSALSGFVTRHGEYKIIDVIRIIDLNIQAMQLPIKPEEHYGSISALQRDNLVRHRIGVYRSILASSN